MIFRQLFDSVSGTYSYLLASRAGGEALILDPVLEKADRYCQLLRELDLRLVKAVDTHLHADHVTGLGELRDRTQCITIMGEQSKADVVSMRVSDGDKGDTVSTIGEERRYNPRLQVRSVDEYIELMANLKLPNPKMMDVAVPANMHVGLHQEELAKQGLALSARDAINSLGRPDILLVDLRETSERAKHGTISGALHAPYPGIAESLKPGGMLREVAAATGRRVVFF